MALFCISNFWSVSYIKIIYGGKGSVVFCSLITVTMILSCWNSYIEPDRERIYCWNIPRQRVHWPGPTTDQGQTGSLRQALSSTVICINWEWLWFDDLCSIFHTVIMLFQWVTENSIWNYWGKPEWVPHYSDHESVVRSSYSRKRSYQWYMW